MPKERESMKPERDIYAEIAASRTEYRDANLITPGPPDLPDKHLTNTDAEGLSQFEIPAKMSNAEELSRELTRTRNQHLPFLEDFAPDLTLLRGSFPLSNADWRIETAEDQSDINHVFLGKGEWENVAIPHYGAPVGRAASWYRICFDIKTEDLNRGAVFVCFKAVDYKATVYLNNTCLGFHEGFFAPFEFEITQHAKIGQNVLTVRVENDFNRVTEIDGVNHDGDKIYAATGLGWDDPESGWHHCPPGMGICQDLSIETRDRLHFADSFVRPIFSADNPAQFEFAEAWIELSNCDSFGKNVCLSLSLYGQNFETTVFENHKYIPETAETIGIGDSLSEAKARAAGTLGQTAALEMYGGRNYLKIPFEIPAARIWDLDTPWLYQLQVTLTSSGSQPIDALKQQFGVRNFRQDENSTPKGKFYLNGNEIRLRGANTMGYMQQDVLKKDYDQLIDDILLAKICNMNFLRLTQRPVQSEIYDYCDRLGLMLQTDLPLFGHLRTSQFVEAVRQAGEMEALVRSHPSNILLSYINEPLNNSSNQPHRYLDRDSLTRFFEAADIAVRQQNPDRVIKPVDGDYDPPAPGLQDRHCYPGWYNGHGIDIGALHKGYWQPVAPGWHTACGEYGAEGLEAENVMREYYPSSWLPVEGEDGAKWTPNSILMAQTGRFHYFFFDSQDSLPDWIEASQTYQAEATEMMTEAFRRDSRMNSFAIHLFIDAFPAGWMKTIMDVKRQPKKGFFTYRNALEPLMMSLRTDRFTYYAGEDILI
ncbi:MAG: glycoside hydrolase family 2, partial [Spirochaetales bacterium]|nr:glycoside hydrolase family 2 [Spirochaetales bacterium]